MAQCHAKPPEGPHNVLTTVTTHLPVLVNLSLSLWLSDRTIQITFEPVAHGAARGLLYTTCRLKPLHLGADNVAIIASCNDSGK